MSPFYRHHYHGYHLGAFRELTSDQVQQLHLLIENPPPPANDVLAGRQGVTIASLKGFGSVAVKHYARGGLIRHVNNRTYVHWPQSRGEKEFQWLEVARAIGLAAPRPVAFAYKGQCMGPCWLVMTTIPRQRSLIQITQEKSDHRQSVYEGVVAQIRILIHHGIWHRDLHPGNVLVDEKGTAHIIDFDKARYLKNRDRLTSLYIKRWQRAIAKHGLPPALAAILTREALGS